MYALIRKEKTEDSTACKPWISKKQKVEENELSSTAENYKATSNADMVHKELSNADMCNATTEGDLSHIQISSDSQKAQIQDLNPSREHSGESSLTSKRQKLRTADVDDGQPKTPKTPKTPENLKVKLLRFRVAIDIH